MDPLWIARLAGDRRDRRVIRDRSRPDQSGRDGVCTVRRIGLIHCALAAQALISLVQVLLTMRTMGIPESHIDLIAGLDRHRSEPDPCRWPVAPVRSLARLWRSPGMRSCRCSASWSAWGWYYRVPIDPANMARAVASKMHAAFSFRDHADLPRIKRVFAKRAQAEASTGQPSGPDGAIRARRSRRSAGRSLQLLTLLFLIVVCSNLVVDATDWSYRLVFDTESVP